MSPLQGKKLLITGVINRESIAYEVAKQAQAAGAEIVLTGFGRAKRMTDRSAAKLDPVPDVLELDVNKPEDIEAVADDLRERWGRVDGILHAIAFAPEDALGGNFLNTPVESAIDRVPDVGVLAEGAGRRPGGPVSRRRARRSSGSTSTRRSPGRSMTGWAWPRPRWRPPRATSRVTSARAGAREPGVRRAAGHARRARHPGLQRPRRRAWEKQAPLPWDVEDPAPVAETINFLLCDAARAITAEIIHVDGGFHAMGTQIAPVREEVEA